MKIEPSALSQTYSERRYIATHDASTLTHIHTHTHTHTHTQRQRSRLGANWNPLSNWVCHCVFHFQSLLAALSVCVCVMSVRGCVCDFVSCIYVFSGKHSVAPLKLSASLKNLQTGFFLLFLWEGSATFSSFFL